MPGGSMPGWRRSWPDGASTAIRGPTPRRSSTFPGCPRPTEGVDAFSCDPWPEACDRVVARLLDSDAHGVRWARWWLDLARFGESNGFGFDEFRPAAWHYRDWVVKALNRDMPYDEFA